MEFIKTLNNILWGPASAFVILSGALFLLFKLKFFYLLHPLKCLGIFKKGGFLSMVSALGGSIGVGNIVGVGVALSLGGAGAVFWMWICALFTAVLKYCEIYLAVKYKNANNGGAMYYLKLCKIPFLPQLFCILCIISSFGIGCAVQSNALAKASETTNLSPSLSGIVLSILCAATFYGGGKLLQKVSKYLVPIMSLLYIAGALFVVVLKADYLSEVFSDIFRDAFSFKSASGGIGASLFVSGIKEGMSKGIFSAESGMGSSALMYSFDNNETPENQGLWGIIEVFADTIVMCTLSALVILLTKENDVFSAYASVFGDKSNIFVLISMFCFAYTSICCWNFYANTCISFLTKRKTASFIFNAVFAVTIYIGATSELYTVWALSDLSNALMLFLNFFGLVYLNSHVKSPL